MTTDINAILAPIRADINVHIVDRVLQANRVSADLQEYRQEALSGKENAPWHLEGGLLMHTGRLVVPGEGHLRARLLDESTDGHKLHMPVGTSCES